MGCYGIGVNRIVAGLIETSHDEDGIIWPVALAPYEVLLLPLNVTEPQTIAVAEQLHEELSAAGIEVLLDDRDVRAGVKFKDADLIGIPLRVVIGQRGLKQGKLEIKWRWERDSEMIDLDGAAEMLADLIRQERGDAKRFSSRAADSA
jgi:prolyl-tRNA synthetase